jgi:hypothetical protein
MKNIFSLFFFVLTTRSLFAADLIDTENLRMDPVYPCRIISKKPPPQKYYKGFSTLSNYPLINNHDINGDGICDWIGTGALAPHRDGYLWDEPELRDFIFLGTSSGWRRFGNMKKIDEYMRKFVHGSDFPLFPHTQVSEFIDPIFIYQSNEPVPFVITLDMQTDLLESKEDDISISQWNKNLDTLIAVKKTVRQQIINFLSKKLCKEKANYIGAPNIEDAICRFKNKTTEGGIKD